MVGTQPRSIRDGQRIIEVPIVSVPEHEISSSSAKAGLVPCRRCRTEVADEQGVAPPLKKQRSKLAPGGERRRPLSFLLHVTALKPTLPGLPSGCSLL